MFQKLDHPVFYANLRKLLKTRFDQEQVSNIKTILKTIDEHGITDNNQVAYILGTCWHECFFKCIKEIPSKKVGSQIWRWQQRYFPQGWYGRGFSQLTWKKNYLKFSPVVGIDLVKNPDAVLDAKVGAKILVFGMMNGSFVALGLYSNTKLSKYFAEGGEPDWIGARKIVNGTFKADEVAIKSGHILYAMVETFKSMS